MSVDRLTVKGCRKK